MRTLPLSVLAALAALLFVGTAQAQGEDAGQALNQTVDESQSLLDQTLDGIGDAAQGLGDAAEKTGEGVGKGASAVGRFLADAAKAIGRAAQATAAFVAGAAQGAARGVAAIGLATSLSLSAAALGAGQAAAIGLTLLGAGLAGLFAVTGSAVAGAAVALGGLARDGLVGYVGLIGHLRPDAVPVAVFGTVAVTGAAASTGVGSWAGWAALKKWGWMASGGGIAGFTRIADDELLEHPLRSQIFQVIQTNPGIHASGLARQVGAGWGTITHHLEKLERGHLVATRKINNQKCFFEQGGRVSRTDMAVAGAVRGDTASDIAGYVLGHPMTSQKDMAGSLDLSPALVSFHVKKLVNLGVLDKIRHGKETLLTTSDALRRVLAAEKSPAAHVELKDESFEYTS